MKKINIYRLIAKTTNVLKLNYLFAIVFMFSIVASALGENLVINSLFTDHMILQRDISCPVWGWATPGDVVTVSFAGQEKETTADTNGHWEVRLDPLAVDSKGQELVVKGENGSIQKVFKDVLVGDVWLCSGQSNMSFGLLGANQWWRELPSAPVDGIRIFWVQPTSCFDEADDVVASKWHVASSHSLKSIKSPYTSVAFSAIAWFYGRKLHEETGIPIGLIESAQGNTAIQPWSKMKSLGSQDNNYSEMTSLSAYEKQLTEWAEGSDPEWAESSKWILPEYSDEDWQIVEIPEGLTSTLKPQFNGLMWFRKHVNIPADSNNLILNLGALQDQTAVWFNGHFIGADDKTRKGVDGNDIEHVFTIPAAFVKSGDNVIAVRVIGKNGLTADNQNICYEGTEKQSIPLSGNWSFRMSTPVSELLKRRSQPLRIWAYGSLYNGMIAPLAPFAIKGAIWYQGEGNAGQLAYEQYLTNLIRDWRELFGIGDFPFYIVQLAGYGDFPVKPSDSGWATTREHQAKVAEKVSNSGLAVAIDRGEIHDIHPPNKRDVGERLALVALAKDYNKDIAYEGPTFKSISFKDGHAKVSFDHAKGLKSIGAAPSGFAIYGENGKWVWAYAKIEDETIDVWHPDIQNPVAVRYGWGNNIMCNLYNDTDLPAVPFRTDSK